MKHRNFASLHTLLTSLVYSLLASNASSAHISDPVGMKVLVPDFSQIFPTLILQGLSPSLWTGEGGNISPHSAFAGLDGKELYFFCGIEEE